MFSNVLIILIPFCSAQDLTHLSPFRARSANRGIPTVHPKRLSLQFMDLVVAVMWGHFQRHQVWHFVHLCSPSVFSERHCTDGWAVLLLRNSMCARPLRKWMPPTVLTPASFMRTPSAGVRPPFGASRARSNNAMPMDRYWTAFYLEIRWDQKKEETITYNHDVTMSHYITMWECATNSDNHQIIASTWGLCAVRLSGDAALGEWTT